jgi:nitrogen-specific signal transduction histidine kinase
VTAVDRSLLAFLDAPIAIGDPEGLLVWANPAFEARFGADGTRLTGRPLAEIFGGQGRERLLGALARVCRSGETERFALREAGTGFETVVSAIVAEGEKVGAVILLKEAEKEQERLIALHRQLQDPLDTLEIALDSLLEQTGGRRAERYRHLVEDGARAVTRLRKLLDEVGSALGGRQERGPERFDVGLVLRRVASAAAERVHATSVEALAAHALAQVEGDETRLEQALTRMVAARRDAEPGARRIVLGARPIGRGAEILVSIAELFDVGAPPLLDEPPEAHAALEDLGARLDAMSDPKLGRVTLLRLRTGGG